MGSNEVGVVVSKPSNLMQYDTKQWLFLSSRVQRNRTTAGCITEREKNILLTLSKTLNIVTFTIMSFVAGLW